MPGATTPITDREKAAILALKIGIIQDAKTAYIVAEDKARKDVPQNALKSMISKWINSDKVKTFSGYVDRLLADRDADARQRGRQEERNEGGQEEGKQAESDRSQHRQAKDVDYYDPANQRKQINRIIQESSDDPKTQLDAIKAIQQTQRDDRQAARDQKQVQTYLPLRCFSCPLMEKERRKAGK